MRAFWPTQRKALSIKVETIIMNNRAETVSKLERRLRPLKMGKKASEIDRMLRKASSMNRIEDSRQKKELEVQAFSNL